MEGAREVVPKTLTHPTSLFNLLFGHEAFRSRLAERIRTHFSPDGALTADATVARWRARMGELEAAIPAEIARWANHRGGDALSEESWRRENNRILNHYLPERASFARLIFDYLGYDGSAVEAHTSRELGTLMELAYPQ